MTEHPSIAFLRVLKSGRFSLPEIADRIGLSVDDTREILHRGVDVKRLAVRDTEDRRTHWIEALS